MTIMDKLKFWKPQEPDFGDLETDIERPKYTADGFEDNLGIEKEDRRLGMQEINDEEEHYDSRVGQLGQVQTVRSPPQFGREAPMNQQSQMNQYQQTPQSQNHIEKDLEIISTKLELLKVSIESVNQRLINIERKLDNQEKRW